VLDGDSAPPQKGAEPSNFRPMSIAAKRLHESRCHLVFGTDVALSPDDIVLDGDPAATSPKSGRIPLPIFGPCPLWPNGCMDQDGTWNGGGPWSRPHCARWGLSSPPQNGAGPPILGPFSS